MVWYTPNFSHRCAHDTRLTKFGTTLRLNLTFNSSQGMNVRVTAPHLLFIMTPHVSLFG